MALSIQPSDTSDVYAPVITSFLARTFPANLDAPANVLDALTEAFVSSSQVRNGPAPKPEGLVGIRERLTYWMARGEPIAVLSPWGSKKTVHGHSIDVAEVMALRQLEALKDRVTRVYAPGVAIALGIEDLGGFYLWADEGAETRHESQRYVQDFSALVRILGLNSFIDPVAESTLIDAATFDAAADARYPVLLDYLLTRSPAAYDALHQLGWRGDVPLEMVEFYLRSYEKLYPSYSGHERMAKLARYLAQSAARYAVGVKVRHAEWIGHYVQVNFPTPVPGLPSFLGDSRLYYRTLPLRFAKTTMPAWRAKGYLCVSNTNEVTPKLASWFEPNDYTPMRVSVSNGEDSVVVEADYILR